MPLQVRGAFVREGLAFAEELAARAAVAVDNARRYTHEVIWTEHSTQSPADDPAEMSADALLDQWEDPAW
ncbi:hypothetical protein [Streptomyces violaceus]|uniref:Uncharacterized protein n=1 Tax=Streptomyces violaceus TaxID=1936 RepID=A0ABY9U1E4_STRVL|nr:hypothetical protein [Streptomyces janthinus]WND16077.1 hypothetical protein RI060_01335 [Streptomyces janthinus]GGS94609.1 hypothetical protein GCM10010270_78320 [Streptomyces janthinus]